MQGLGSHQPRRAYETCQSTGSPCDLKKWCGVTVMLRAGSVSTGVTGQAASLAGYRRMVWSADESSALNADDSSALHRYWHGGWVLPPHSQGLESCALLVCHRRLEKRSTIQGHRGGHTTTHSPQSLATLAALCVLGWQIESNRSAIAYKERTPLPSRQGGIVPTGVSRWMFRCLWHTSQGSRFVMSNLGQKAPDSSPWHRSILYRMAAILDISVEGCEPAFRFCFGHSFDSTRSQPGRPCPGVDCSRCRGFLCAVRFNRDG